MAKILAFAGSSSNNSINRQLVEYTVSLLSDHEVTFLDLNDFFMPIYDIDYENAEGVPDKAQLFKRYIDDADGIIVSFAEHNGSYAVIVKNIMDWCSRLEGKLWSEKPIFVMASSPGARGGSSVLAQAVGRIPFNGGQVVSQFSLPSFFNNFSKADGITDPGLKQKHKENLDILLKTL